MDTSLIPIIFTSQNILASDSFNRPDNASIGNLDTGQTWVVLLGTPTISNNAVVWTSYTSNNGLTVVDVMKPNVILSGDITWQSSSYTRLALRMTDANNGFYAEIESGKSNLRRVVAGVSTVIGTFSHSTTFGSVFHYDVLAAGNQISIFLNGSPIITVTDTFNQNATLMGIGRNNSVSSFNSVQDNFKVIEA